MSETIKKAITKQTEACVAKGLRMILHLDKKVHDIDSLLTEGDTADFTSAPDAEVVGDQVTKEEEDKDELAVIKELEEAGIFTGPPGKPAFNNDTKAGPSGNEKDNKGGKKFKPGETQPANNIPDSHHLNDISKGGGGQQRTGTEWVKWNPEQIYWWPNPQEIQK